MPQLVARGHEVTATTTSAGKLGLLAELGAEGIVMDGLDAASVGEAVAAAQPDAIVNQMTGLSEAHAGKPNLRKADRFFAATNRLRSEGIDHLLAAAEATGVSHVVAQGHASMNGIRQGGWVKTEEDPLEVMEGTKAINHLEDVVVRAGGAVLRYGGFYGPGADDDQVKLVRKRMFPLVGGGTGYVSWVHVDDAASATVLAMEQKAKGVFNIVDDEPAPVSEWLPYLAECAGAKPPRRVPGWLARLLAGEMAVGMMTEGRGFSNAKAKRELGWELRYPSWRQGFKAIVNSGARMTRGEEFEELRPLLFAIAYRILGSVAEAEDAVQETWLRYEASPTQPTSTKAFLSAVVTRVSIDVLRSARVRREDVRRAVVPRAAAHRPVSRIRRGRRSWRTRCRWRRCCCSSGSARSNGRSSCCGTCSGSTFPRSHRPSVDPRRRAASSRCGRGATWTTGARGSRRTAGNARSWRRGSSTRSAMATSTNSGSCSLPTSRWSGMGEARGLRSPRAWSVSTTWPACSPRSSRCSPGSTRGWSHAR